MTIPGHRVLLVDNDADERLLTTYTLNRLLHSGSTVFVASSGNEAIRYMIGEGRFCDRDTFPFPTLVISDLEMVDGDGFDVLEFLQYNAAWSVVPRIIYSSSDDDDDVRTAFLLGASAYHLKPTGATESRTLLQLILRYWGHSQVPPITRDGKLLVTNAAGQRGTRYPPPIAAASMERPIWAQRILTPLSERDGRNGGSA